jgi:dolichol-phosphate mannosyltransferase
MARHPNRIDLIERQGKQGLGSAYRAGFQYALERGFSYICEMDADLSHNPNDLLRLIEPVRVGKADLAVGSRYIDGVRVMNWPLSRLVLSYGAGVYTRVITRLPVYDVTAGFKCYHRKVLAAIDLDRVKSTGYSFQIEMKYRAWRLGYKIIEVPIVFTERTEGQSKMSKAIVREAAYKVWEIRLRDLLKRL